MKKKLRSPLYRRRNLMIGILIFAALFTIGTFIVVIPVLIDGAERKAVIKIPVNATDNSVRDTLETYLGKEFADKVMRLVDVREIDWSERHGSYLVEKGDSPYEVLRRIKTGAPMPVKVVVNGFRGVPVLAERLHRKLEFTPEEFQKALYNPELLAKYNLNTDNALALFLNDTYEVYWATKPTDFIEKIGKYYNLFWTEERRKQADQLGLTPAEVITLASIVDEETNTMDEKGKIARLYMNRLEKGMKLQADPTVRFAIGDFTIKRVKGEHLKYQSPYNTYLYGGLPPGPIRTPAKSTIDAVLTSEPNNYIYMCAKEDFSGRHNFAATYEEHLQNAKRYQDELDRRGIE